MPTKTPFTLIILALALIPTSSVLSAEQDDQQLTNLEQSDTTRSRKPEIAERQGIRAALEALRNNGVLQRATRLNQNAQASQQTNQIAARAQRRLATQSTTSEAESTIPIKHVLTCETEQNCQTAVEWGNSNNFNTTEVLTTAGHGGETMYHLFLRQNVLPDEEVISTESSRVYAGIETMEGIRYNTWMVDLDPEGTQDRGRDQ